MIDSTRRWLPHAAALLGALAGGALLILLALGPGSAAAASHQLQVSTRPGDLATGGKVQVVVKGAGKDFEAIIGATKVTKQFHRVAGGKRVAMLHRGGGLKVGLNRIAIGSGQGASRRWAADTVVVGARRKGALRVKRQRSHRTAVILWLRGPKKHGFEHLRITINGKRLQGRSWVIGERTRSGDWPLGHRSFRAGFGATDGLHYGSNEVKIVAWNDRGDYDRVVRRVDIARGAPLVDAGESKRVQVGRRVVLDGSGTRGGKGSKIRYRWTIVSKPKHSKAHLRGAHGSRPRLVADRLGRYRVRLVASRGGVAARGSKKKSAKASASAVARVSATAPSETTPAASVPAPTGGPAPASDETVIEATPQAAPIGVPIQTLTASGAVQVGGSTYQPSSGSWAQLVVLDRSTLALERNESFGSGGTATPADAEALNQAVQGLSTAQLAIVSGGGRTVSAPEQSNPTFGSQFDDVVETLGGSPEGIAEFSNAWNDIMPQGRWSMVGVPHVPGSGYTNLFGGIFGVRAGEGSPSGAISGYLQQTTPDLYSFAQGNYTPIDTQVPGAPAGTNQIRVGEHIYTSSPLAAPQNGSGFQVLVLNSLLEPTAQRTFTVSVGGISDLQEVVAMEQFLTNLSDPVSNFPGYLVIVQSIGNPEGSIGSWVDDEPLVTNAYEVNKNATVPRNHEVWYSQQNGVSLAGAFGALGGPAAHDQIAQMSSQNFEKPNPTAAPGGFSMVASVGSWSEEFNGPVDPGSPPVSRLQSLTPGSEARIVGTLARDRQSFWTIESAGWFEGLAQESITELAYQPPTPWPLSTTPEQKAANTYISEEEIGLPYPEVREAYYRDSGANWGLLLDRLERAKYPKDPKEVSFNKATFQALKEQLEEEFLMVGEVREVVENWNKVFTSSKSVGAIDLQNVASPIVKTIKSLDKGASNSSANTEAIIGESFWAASSVVTLTGQEEISDGLGVIATAFDLASTLSSSGASSGPDAGPVEAEAEELGVAVATRFEAVQNHVELLDELLVSDWGKLQQASKRARKDWNFNRELRTGLTRSIETSAKREFNAALLSTAYDVYVVSPTGIAAGYKTPAQVECYESNPESHTIHPLDSIETSPSSWISRPVGFKMNAAGEGESVIQRWFGMTIPEEGEETEHLQAVPQSITGDLFHPMSSTEKEYLGQDPVSFFADSRFHQRWYWCLAVEEH